MKKLYSTIMMLAMMVAALGLTACGGDDDDIVSDGSSSFLVGTWSLTSAQGWGLDSDGEPEYLQLKSDGTYINVQFDDGLYITKGTWRATDTELIMKETEGKIKSTYTYKILNHTQSSLTLEMLGITANLTKVPDSTIDKYLDGSVNHYEGNSSSSVFTIVYTSSSGKETTDTYDNNNKMQIQTLGAEFSKSNGAASFYFSFSQMWLSHFKITFPSDKYGNLGASDFYQGFSSFNSDDLDIKYTDLSGSYNTYSGKYMSGSAQVIKNDGKYITVNYTNYKVLIKMGWEKDAYLKLNGPVPYTIR